MNDIPESAQTQREKLLDHLKQGLPITAPPSENVACCNFVNLTNGLQAVIDYNLTNFRFIRLQSTACEQKRWEEIVLTISDDFLMAAALGLECVVYDYGANKEIPRAVWQGLEWLKYTLNRRWHKQFYMPQGRAATSIEYFATQYNMLSKRAKSRLDYFGRYVAGPLKISAITSATDRDGDIDWYTGIIKCFRYNTMIDSAAETTLSRGAQ